MADLTDLEITKLCAEAMGYETEEWSKSTPAMSVSELAARIKIGEKWSPYDPLHDDAQCMALVKGLRLFVSLRTDGSWAVWTTDSNLAIDTDLNRAICLCVARMQQAKEEGNG